MSANCDLFFDSRFWFHFASSQSVRYTASKSVIGLLRPMDAMLRARSTSARLRARNLDIRSPVLTSKISQTPAATLRFLIDLLDDNDRLPEVRLAKLYRKLLDLNYPRMGKLQGFALVI